MERMKAARATAWEAAGSRDTHVPHAPHAHARTPHTPHALARRQCEKASKTTEDGGREGLSETDRHTTPDTDTQASTRARTPHGPGSSGPRANLQYEL